MESTSSEQLMFTRVGLHGQGNRSKAFDAIDTIRELQVGELSLPQLVAVGDQSCGKSSVMESITGIPFPVGSGLCTRFATQIVLRRSDIPKDLAMVHATIVPGPTSIKNEEAKNKLENFLFSYKESDFGIDVFKEVLAKAAKVMGINPDATDAAPGNRFSDDLLKLELSASHHSHLTIVDVPGLFHLATRYQTEEDKALIRELIKRYVNDPRTIIIAVMDGVNDLSNQEVFQMAMEADKEGKRTIGVITKCDRVPTGDEKQVLQIAGNKVVELLHGWYVVRNRSTTESRDGITMDERRRNEEIFFQKAPWNTLNPNRIGIDKLKLSLGRLLDQHIRDELPKLAEEINQITMETMEMLANLGEPRVDIKIKRQYLFTLAKNYENQVSRWLDGKVGYPACRPSPLKIRTHIRDMNDNFAANMKARGHSRPFKTIDGSEADESGHNQDDSRSLGLGNEPRDIYEWIRESHKNSRGPELDGTVNHNLVVQLFREQAEKWGLVAREHIRAVIGAVEKFNTELFTKIISDELVRKEIMRRIASETSETYIAAYRRLDEVISAEFDGILQTVDPAYKQALEDSKTKRIRARLMKTILNTFIETDPTDDTSETRPNIDRYIGDLSLDAFKGTDVIVEDIHDILKAYYPVALKRFIATVNLQVVEQKLLGEGGPVRLFKTEYVNQLKEDEINDITQEDTSIINARKELESRLGRAMEATIAVKSV